MTDRKPAIIVDLDGTLFDTKHRLHHILKEPKDWVAFTAACVDDTPVPYVIAMVRAMHKQGARVFVCSGRRDSVRPQTMVQLKKSQVLYSRLFMRAAGDERSDEEIKKIMLDQIREEHEVLFAVDDRPEVIKMFRENGVPCFVVEQEDWRDQLWAAAIREAIECVMRCNRYGADSWQGLEALLARGRDPAVAKNRNAPFIGLPLSDGRMI